MQSGSLTKRGSSWKVLVGLVAASLLIAPVAPSFGNVIAVRMMQASSAPQIAINGTDVTVSSDYWEDDAIGNNTLDVDRVTVSWYNCTDPAATGGYLSATPTGCSPIISNATWVLNTPQTGGVMTFTPSTETYLRASLTILTYPAQFPVQLSKTYWTESIDISTIQQNQNNNPAAPEPFSGPIIQEIDFRPPAPADPDSEEEQDNRPRPGGDIVFRGPNVDQIEEVEIGGKPADVEHEDGDVVATIPEDVEPGLQDVLVSGPFGDLLLEDAVNIAPLPEINQAEDADVAELVATNPGNCSPNTTEFSAWTQDQLDGTVLFFAKNVVGAGTIEFQQNRKVLKSLVAKTTASPNIRWGNCAPYFVHRFTREDVKNGLEVYRDGVRVWRAAYSGLGLAE